MELLVAFADDGSVAPQPSSLPRTCPVPREENDDSSDDERATHGVMVTGPARLGVVGAVAAPDKGARARCCVLRSCVLGGFSLCV